MSGIQSIRNSLTGNITKVIVAAIIITFIGSVGWAGFFSEGNANVAVKVGSKTINTSDLSFEFSSQQSLIAERFPDQVVDEEILLEISTNSLVSKFSVLNYLDQRSLDLPDDFIFQQLSSSDQFLENGTFSRANFDAFARSNGFIPSDYLKRIREDFKNNIWRLSITNSSFITNLEVENSINLAEQERNISFVKYPAKKFRNSVEYTDDDLRSYYNLNSKSYTTPQQVKVNYIEMDQETLIDSSNVSEDEIREAYEDYLSDFDDTVRKSVSHIMIDVNDSRSLEEATLILSDAKKDIDSGTSFEVLVKEISEDEGTKEMDGSLGVTDGTLLPPEFESALEKMSAGEVSEPINLLNSVHLIKLVSAEQPTPSSLEDRKIIIIERLASEKAEDEYFELLDQVSELSFTAGNLDEIAETIPFSKIELDFFSENNTPEVLNTAAIKDFIFNLSEQGDYPELFESEGLKAVIVQLKENISETQLTLDQVKEKVTEDYIEKESFNLSKLFVADQLSNLNEGSSLETLASNEGLELENYMKLKRDSSLLPVSAIDNIFALPRSGVGNIHSSVNMSNGDLILFRLDAVESGQTDLDEEQKTNLNNFLNQQKSLAELSELQLSLQNSLKIERFN
tara:strand:+ start:1045 stop:2919 length:1875 start_codon:yes stop_codon:yes gene_type:complete